MMMMMMTMMMLMMMMQFGGQSDDCSQFVGKHDLVQQLHIKVH